MAESPKADWKLTRRGRQSSWISFCRFDARPLPVFDELEFRVGDHAEDGDDHSTHASGCRDFGLKNRE